MPLFCDGTVVGHKLESITKHVTSLPYVQEDSKALCKREVQQLYTKGVLFVGQRELATVLPTDDSVRYLGSEDATTCHMIVLREENSGGTCFSHCDGSDVENCVDAMMSSLRQACEEHRGARSSAESAADAGLNISLHLVGGFKDGRKMSAQLSAELLSTFHARPERINLKTACVTALNNCIVNGINKPCIYGIAVDIATGQVFPAKFNDKGPDQLLRTGRCFTGSQETIDIYNRKTHELCFGPFSYSAIGSEDLILAAPDEFILKHFSTSPDAEPPYYASQTKQTIAFLRDNPPHQMFANGARRYRCAPDGSWCAVGNMTPET